MDVRISRISFRRAALAVSDLILPRVCTVCGRRLLLPEEHICTKCEADLPRTFFSSQRDNPMALAFNGACSCEAGFQPFGYATALLFYRDDSPYKNIPMKLKYGRNFGEGLHFARMLGREMAGSPLFAGIGAVIPVPLHRARRWKRGYNQAEVVARGIVEGYGGDCGTVLTGVLRRVRRTGTQTRLHGDERYANVKSAFRADAGRLSKAFGGKIPEHILLVDDVFTTGSTASACERALRLGISEAFGPDAAGRVRISVATLSFVGR